MEKAFPRKGERFFAFHAIVFLFCQASIFITLDNKSTGDSIE